MKGATAKQASMEKKKSELERIRAYDRQQHIQKGIEMGLSREEAEEHADDELRERSDARA